MPPLHVAVLMAGSHLGGAERSLLSLVQRSGGEIRFTLLLPEDGELAAEVRRVGVASWVTEWPPRLLALGESSGRPSLLAVAGAVPAIRRAARSVRERVEAVQADVLVTNGIKPHLLGALALLRQPDLPLVWYLRESTEGRRLSRQVLALAGSRCDAAIAVSKSVAADAGYYLPAAVPVDVAYNIVDVVFPGHEADDADRPVKADGECWFAIIGALTALKGHDVFLRAAAVTSRELPGARFLIVGANSYATERNTGYERELRRLVGQLDLEHRVRFLGYRRDVPELLRDIDVLVQPNTSAEGFSRSVAEAMRAGVPVIASAAWTFKELIEDGRTGWLVPVGDVAALSERMVAVGRDPAARRACADRARAFIVETTKAERSIATFTRVLAGAAEKRARGRAGVHQ